jgi:endoglucanase
MPNEGNYFIKHHHAGFSSFLTLDVPGGSLADNILIQQFGWHGGPNQQWRLTNVGDGYFTIVSVHSNRALDVPGGFAISGLPIQQFTQHGGPNQQWRFVTTPAATGPELFRPEFHQIINRATDMALDVPNGALTFGTIIQQFPPHRGFNQTWILEKVPSG